MKFRFVLQLATSLIALSLASGRVAFANDVDDATAEDEYDAGAVPPEPATDDVVFKATSITAPFLEQFTPETADRWHPSETKKIVDGIEDEELLNYRGRWKIEEATVFPAIVYDKGLVVKTPAAHHAISALFPEPIDPADKGLVVQYEVKLQNGLECGGAYMKLLTHDAAFEPTKFSDKSPYTITHSPTVFGPDKCGMTNKVHFIFRHKNPITGEFEEKHLNAPPAAKISKTSTVYTLIVRPDNSFEILINNESSKKGSLLTDFTPAVNPPKEIDDPEDKKPEDWVDVAKIADPDAKKPDDWDEDAPMQIVDEDAVMPEDWLEEEPLTIPDPESVKPEDWDDDEDGDWVAPTVDNPKCAEVSGCGPWTKPMKANPDYKGKWRAPMIDNPAYKGPWAPRRIPNPKFFEDLHPAKFNKIGAIGFELWTMQDGILFDNIYIGHSEADAKALLEETWAVKSKLEGEQEKKEAPKSEDEPKGASIMQRVMDVAEDYRYRIVKIAQQARNDPIGAFSADPSAAGIGIFFILWGFYSIASIASMYIRGKPAPAAAAAPEKKDAAKKTDAPSADDKPAAGAPSAEAVPKVEKTGGATKRAAAKKE
ncbi:calnexin [Zopfochytrium polystomum]|nr:calnexin [Zopfochytrium polystomum]